MTTSIASDIFAWIQIVDAIQLQGYVDDKTRKRLDRLVKWTLPEGIRKRGQTKAKRTNTQENRRTLL